MSDTASKKTPLYDEHLRLNAKMVPFGDWIMPVQYTSIMDEHLAVRRNVGVFDISHMGQLVATGTGAAEWLNEMLTNNVEKLEIGSGQYTFLLNEEGGIIDDLILYRTGDSEFLLVVNASRTDEDLAWLDRHRPIGGGTQSDKATNVVQPVGLVSRSGDHGAIAIQGPHVIDLLETLVGDRTRLPTRNHIVNLEIDGMPVSIARTGYTGEDGVEIFLRNADAAKVWNIVLRNGAPWGIKPCGLGARDTLRLEMCYPLNGSDLSPQNTPIEAGLSFFVDLNKPRFVGRGVLIEAKERGPATRLAAFRMTGKGPPPRPHYAVWRAGERIGETSSGTLSPSLNHGIGMAYLPPQHAGVGTEIEIEIRGQRFPAVIEKKPLYNKKT